ncbi:MAG TPA: hypothetical protein VN030_08065 [Cellvibrio sp.]|nr:hypothetical protein [Cellvibrio sp.]
MIEYKYQQEKDFIIHYAIKLERPVVEGIINTGEVHSSRQASALARFFWDMTDEIVKDRQHARVVVGQSDLAAWNEYTFESIRAYLLSSGYQREWDEFAGSFEKSWRDGNHLQRVAQCKH